MKRRGRPKRTENKETKVEVKTAPVVRRRGRPARRIYTGRGRSRGRPRGSHVRSTDTRSVLGPDPPDINRGREGRRRGQQRRRVVRPIVRSSLDNILTNVARRIEDKQNTRTEVKNTLNDLFSNVLKQVEIRREVKSVLDEMISKIPEEKKEVKSGGAEGVLRKRRLKLLDSQWETLNNTLHTDGFELFNRKLWNDAVHDEPWANTLNYLGFNILRDDFMGTRPAPKFVEDVLNLSWGPVNETGDDPVDIENEFGFRLNTLLPHLNIDTKLWDNFLVMKNVRPIFERSNYMLKSSWYKCFPVTQLNGTVVNGDFCDWIYGPNWVQWNMEGDVLIFLISLCLCWDNLVEYLEESYKEKTINSSPMYVEENRFPGWIKVTIFGTQTFGGSKDTRPVFIQTKIKTVVNFTLKDIFEQIDNSINSDSSFKILGWDIIYIGYEADEIENLSNSNKIGTKDWQNLNIRRKHDAESLYIKINLKKLQNK